MRRSHRSASNVLSFDGKIVSHGANPTQNNEEDNPQSLLGEISLNAVNEHQNPQDEKQQTNNHTHNPENYQSDTHARRDSTFIIITCRLR